MQMISNDPENIILLMAQTFRMQMDTFTSMLSLIKTGLM